MKNLFALLFIFVSANCVADAQIAVGGNYTLDQSVITSGGMSTGGALKVEGNAGQAAAGTKQTDTPYNFYSGFWTAQQNFAPTAAAVTVSGRVLTANGRGIRGVQVTLTDARGASRTIFSGKSGYFRFGDVAAGETYIFSVAAKRYAFSQPMQVRSIVENIDDINFVAETTKQSYLDGRDFSDFK